MRIAVFGTGGAGAYFGAQLARAGEDVIFIARGEHLQAIRARGLRVETPEGEIVIRPTHAWEKFLFVVSWGGIGALARAPVGVTRSVPETRQMIEQSMREIFLVARARQIALPDRVVEKSLALVDSLAPGGTTSLQRDSAGGKPSELDAWNGAVVRLGQEVGVATPLHELILGLTQLRACVPFLLVESHIRRRLDPSGIAGQPGE